MLGDYAAPIFARMVMAEKNLKVGPFSLVSQAGQFAWLPSCGSFYTCMSSSSPSVFITWNTLNFAPVVLSVVLSLVYLTWVLDVGNGSKDLFFFFSIDLLETLLLIIMKRYEHSRLISSTIRFWASLS